MKKAIKIILISIGSLLLLLLLTLLFWLGPTVQFFAETIGSKALGTPLTIEKLSIRPLKGTVLLSNLRLQQPEGYQRTNALSIARLDIAVDISSLKTDTIRIRRIHIDSPHVAHEFTAHSDTISDFLAQVLEFVKIDPNAPSSNPNKKTNDKPAKKVIVEALQINDFQLHAVNTPEKELTLTAGFEQFNASMTNGWVQLDKLFIGNPGKLQTPHLFSLDQLAIRLDPDSIYSDRIIIQSIDVVKPHTWIENHAELTTVSAFMDVAEEYTALAQKLATSVPRSAEQVAKTNDSDAPPPPNVQLQQLMIEDIQLNLLDTTRTNALHQPYLLAGISSIEAALAEGQVDIHQIRLANPPGFSSTNLISLSAIGISLDPASLDTDQIVLSNILIKNPKINLEKTASSGNIAELQQLIMALIPAAPPTEKESPAPDPVPLSEQPVLLNRLQVTNLLVNLTLPPEAFERGIVSGLTHDLNPLNLLDNTSSDESSVKTASASGADTGTLKFVGFDQLSLEPLKGWLTISQLRVANPPLCANPYLTQIEEFHLDIDPDTLQHDVLLIRDIRIQKPKIAYERKLKKDNIEILIATLDQTLHGGEKMLEAAPDTEAEATNGQKVIIEHVLVDNGQVQAKLSAIPTATIPLPDIELNDIGKEDDGASFTEAGQKLYSTLYESILGAVAGTFNLAGDALKGAGGLSVQTLGILGDVVEKGINHVVDTEAEADDTPVPEETSVPEETPTAQPPAGCAEALRGFSQPQNPPSP